jgi:O-antigen biosynthesis protein
MNPPTAPPALHLLDFMPVQRPVVSVIVCAHNQFAHTVACLHALHASQRWNLTSFEVVLVDDASTDATAALEQIQNLRYLRLEPNRGFLRAANAGLAVAEGEHVLFLNNDTLPQGSWLDELVDTLARRPKAGVVGARLVFPDGRVQEAGGIIFSDGHGWNYGRTGEFDDPRHTFERPVDYCSGAALLVRGELIRSLGGFDERFAPAYYEDVDLCFAARARGFEVWYQPDAIVVHFEGVSHGTDEASGLKAYQAHNRATFVQKWAEALLEQHPPRAGSVPMARSRALAGHVIVVDGEVPTPDRDAGSQRLIAILEAMVALGYGVTYLPFNGWRRAPYTRQLERIGVEVEPYNPDAWKLVLEQADRITHAWVARPVVAEALLPRLRAELPHVRVLYDTVDLHFLREERQAALGSDPALALRAADTRRRELAIADTVDAVVVVSPHEHTLLLEHTATPVFVVPTVHDLRPARLRPPSGHDLLFVGGFRHPPNQDGMRWFVPTVRLRIVGADLPESFRTLASDAIEVLGWVPALEPLYDQARAAIAPLRYGAGVKGKVGEAMAHGVPVVMTTVAAEGMHITSEVHGLIADDADAFAHAVARVLQDDALWVAMAAQGQSLITERFSTAAVRPLIRAALEPTRAAAPA